MTEPDPHMARRLRERLADETAAAGTRRSSRRRRRSFPSTTAASTRWWRRSSSARSRTRSAPWRRPAASWSRAAACSTWSTSAAAGPGSGAGRTCLQRPWGFFAGGCHPNRATDQAIADAGFWIDSLERDKLPKAPPLVRPLIHGVARRPSRSRLRLGLAAVRLRPSPPARAAAPPRWPTASPSASTCSRHRGHLLLRGSAAEATMNHFRSTPRPACQRPRPALVDGALQRRIASGERRASRSPVRIAASFTWSGGTTACTSPYVERLPRAQRPSLEHHLHRSADPDQPRQPLRPAGARVEVDRHLRQADRDVGVGHEADVAGERGLAAAAGRRPVDRRDEDLVRAVHRQEEVVDPVELEDGRERRPRARSRRPGTLPHRARDPQDQPR